MEDLLERKKTCPVCRVAKSLTEFSRNAGQPDGYQYTCKSCVKAYLQANPEKTREIRKRSRLKHIAKYRANSDALVRKWVAENPTARNAHQKVFRAVRDGRLKRLPCEHCGALKVHAHHPFGYDGENALKVQWLCQSHHRQILLAIKQAA